MKTKYRYAPRHGHPIVLAVTVALSIIVTACAAPISPTGSNDTGNPAMESQTGNLSLGQDQAVPANTQTELADINRDSESSVADDGGSPVGALTASTPVGALAAALGGTPQLIVINFDQDAAGNDIPNGALIGEQYAAWGVHFSPANFFACRRATCYPDYTVRPSLNYLCTFSAVQNVPGTQCQMPVGGYDAKLTVVLDFPINFASIEGYTRNDGVLDGDGVTIQAFDAAGNLLATGVDTCRNNPPPHTKEGVCVAEVSATGIRRLEVLQRPDLIDALDTLTLGIGVGLCLPNAQTEMISVNSASTASGDSNSFFTSPRVSHSVSADGRFIAFQSDASDLTSINDRNNISDIFLRDMWFGTTTLVSHNLPGTDSGNGQSGAPAISADGRFVTFQSSASNLASNDTNTVTDIFVYDRRSGVITLVSVNLAGTNGGNGASREPVISADGRFVAFTSKASNLVSTSIDGSSNDDVFVRDLVEGTTTLVSVSIEGTSGNSVSDFPAISADGRFVAFRSLAGDLVSNDTNNNSDVFVHDVEDGVTTLVSHNLTGTNSGNSVSFRPFISADGRFVAFESLASDLTGINDTNNEFDVFVHDVENGGTTMVSANQSGTDSGNGRSAGSTAIPQVSISADGRFVTFQSFASDLVSNDTNLRADVFVYDMQSGTTTLVSVNLAGTNGGNGGSSEPVISADGRFVTFWSSARDLVNISSNGFTDVFVRDLWNGTTTLVSVNPAGIDGNGGSRSPVISADGRFVVFPSDASDLTSINDTNNTFDMFIRGVNCNQPPTADAGGPYSVDEGGSVTVAASGSDPEGQALTYAWDLDNNGTFETPGQSVNFSAVSLDGPGTQTIAVQVTDEGGLMATDEATVNILNVAPTATFTSTPSTVLVGQSATLAFSTPFDPSAADIAAGFLYSYDCTNDGSFELVDSPLTSFGCTYSAAGVFTALGRITDKDGGFTDYTVTIEVSSLNQPPSADAGGPYSVDEGGSVTVTASGNDPDGGSLIYAWDLDNNGIFETDGQSVTFSAASLDGPSSHAITAQVTDEDGLMATDQATVDVLNVAPTGTFSSAPATLLLGQSATLAFNSPVDPSTADTASGFLYSYDCTDDGSFELADSPLTSFDCTYPVAGVFTARGRIEDKDGGFTDYMAAISVLTPQQATERLAEQVQALIPGSLNNGQGNALIAKLEAAIQQLDRGNATAAINQLEAFVNQVNALVNSGVLLPAEGQPLIDAANAIMASLGG